VSIPHLEIEVRPGLTLRGDVFGDAGPPVLMLHGGGQTRHSWRKTALTLAREGFRAVTFDQRGHGDSDRAPDQAYSFIDFAADAAALARGIAARMGEKPAVVGASLGGLSSLIASGAADGNPFSALILVDVTPRMDPVGVSAVQGFMREKAREGFASVEEAADAIAAYLPHRPRPKSLAGLAKNLRHGADGRFYWHWDPAFIDGPRRIEGAREKIEALGLEAAAALAIPALLVRGGSSELVREDQAREFLSLAKGSEFADVAEARHMVAGDSNGAFTAAVLDFLKRKVAAGPV
jgi:pimeloyl-ACP methyl ester carboxylesterase